MKQQNSGCRAAKIVGPERIVQDSQLVEATESSGGEDPGCNLPCSKVFPLPGLHLRLRISKAVDPAPLPCFWMDRKHFLHTTPRGFPSRPIGHSHTFHVLLCLYDTRRTVRTGRGTSSRIAALLPLLFEGQHCISTDDGMRQTARSSLLLGMAWR